MSALMIFVLTFILVFAAVLAVVPCAMLALSISYRIFGEEMGGPMLMLLAVAAALALLVAIPVAEDVTHKLGAHSEIEATTND